jgi:hypothetical protein
VLQEATNIGNHYYLQVDPTLRTNNGSKVPVESSYIPTGSSGGGCYQPDNSADKITANFRLHILSCTHGFMSRTLQHTACLYHTSHVLDDDDDDDDLQWVRAHKVPMHLGLIDRPFVPHNLLSAQESPVLSPKFQMAPRLKVLMSPGPKKETQIHCPFLSKSPGKRIPSRFPNRAPMERYTCLRGSFTYLQMYLFISKDQE